jgi:hypothetical protein
MDPEQRGLLLSLVKLVASSDAVTVVDETFRHITFHVRIPHWSKLMELDDVRATRS